MSKQARSARGTVVDFDLLAIKSQLLAKQPNVNVDARRKFIDEKDGIKPRENFIYTPQPLDKSIDKVDGPLAKATEGVNKSKVQPK